jgi:hypothetical protein
MAGHGRTRPAMNAGAHTWKACWVQALASSNLASSAMLTCDNAPSSHAPVVLIPRFVSVFVHECRPGVRTPDKRAPWRSGLAGSVRDRPDIRLLADCITLGDREVPGERAPGRRYGRRSRRESGQSGYVRRIVMSAVGCRGWMCFPAGRRLGHSVSIQRLRRRAALDRTSGSRRVLASSALPS